MTAAAKSDALFFIYHYVRDRLIFGNCYNKVRERLLRETGLTIERTDEICRAAEIMTSQMKTMPDNDTAVHTR